MNIYVETNFVLELTFEQEQCFRCAYLHNFGTQLHQLRHPLRGGGKNGMDGQVKFIMRSVDRSRKKLNDN